MVDAVAWAAGIVCLACVDVRPLDSVNSNRESMRRFTGLKSAEHHRTWRLQRRSRYCVIERTWIVPPTMTAHKWSVRLRRQEIPALKRLSLVLEMTNEPHTARDEGSRLAVARDEVSRLLRPVLHRSQRGNALIRSLAPRASAPGTDGAPRGFYVQTSAFAGPRSIVALCRLIGR